MFLASLQGMKQEKGLPDNHNSDWGLKYMD
jgi:hypothetical protein